MTKLTYDDPSISSGSFVNHFCVSLSNLTTLRLVAILCTLLVEGVKAEHVTTSTKDNIIIKEFMLVYFISRGRRKELYNIEYRASRRCSDRSGVVIDDCCKKDMHLYFLPT